MAADLPEIPVVLVRDQMQIEYGNTMMACYDLKKPSSLPHPVLLLKDKLPKVSLHLVQPADLPRLSAMQTINHRNVMRIEALKEIEIGNPKATFLALFVDQYNCPLGVYLDSFDLYDDHGLLPAQGLRDVIRQIISGIGELHRNGFYHGDLSMNNILVSKSSPLLIKLFNFQPRDVPKEVAQLQDWEAVGSLLQRISNELKQGKPQLIYTLIDDLASTLLGLPNIASLQTVEEVALKKLFFWEPRRRINFWIHDVPKAIENGASDEIITAHTWKLPWNSHTHPGLLKEMNDYRYDQEVEKQHNLGNYAPVDRRSTMYNPNDPLQYVRCISGAYTHADNLKGKILNKHNFRMTIDDAVQSNDPGLFIVLYKLLKDGGMIQE